MKNEQSTKLAINFLVRITTKHHNFSSCMDSVFDPRLQMSMFAGDTSEENIDLTLSSSASEPTQLN